MAMHPPSRPSYSLTWLNTIALPGLDGSQTLTTVAVCGVCWDGSVLCDDNADRDASEIKRDSCIMVV